LELCNADLEVSLKIFYFSLTRNHDRYTPCAYHYHESHEGSWQDCKKCKDSFDLPNYIDMGTNEHNFEVIKNPEKVSRSCL
jgi:hypothetical protein